MKGKPKTKQVRTTQIDAKLLNRAMVWGRTLEPPLTTYGPALERLIEIGLHECWKYPGCVK